MDNGEGPVNATDKCACDQADGLEWLLFDVKSVIEPFKPDVETTSSFQHET